MAALINALDNYTPTKFGEKGHVEYEWSNSVQEQIVQFNFQLTRTTNIFPLENRLVSMLEILSHQVKNGTLSEKKLARGHLSILYKMIGHTRDVIDGKGEYNLTYIGYTIGHELSHALDDEGSKFDENGNLHNWWTNKDRKIFQSKINDVIKQYEEFAARDGIKFDASFGVGEDLADISGLSLVEEYLLDNQIIEENIDIIKHNKLKMFYFYIAIQGKQTIYKNALKAQLKINPHPLEKYRTNCPLSRLQLFRQIFGIKKGDGMWWSNPDTIW